MERIPLINHTHCTRLVQSTHERNIAATDLPRYRKQALEHHHYASEHAKIRPHVGVGGLNPENRIMAPLESFSTLSHLTLVQDEDHHEPMNQTNNLERFPNGQQRTHLESRMTARNMEVDNHRNMTWHLDLIHPKTKQTVSNSRVDWEYPSEIVSRAEATVEKDSLSSSQSRLPRSTESDTHDRSALVDLEPLSPHNKDVDQDNIGHLDSNDEVITIKSTTSKKASKPQKVLLPRHVCPSKIPFSYAYEDNKDSLDFLKYVTFQPIYRFHRDALYKLRERWQKAGAMSATEQLQHYQSNESLSLEEFEALLAQRILKHGNRTPSSTPQPNGTGKRGRPRKNQVINKDIIPKGRRGRPRKRPAFLPNPNSDNTDENGSEVTKEKDGDPSDVDSSASSPQRRKMQKIEDQVDDSASNSPVRESSMVISDHSTLEPGRYVSSGRLSPPMAERISMHAPYRLVNPLNSSRFGSPLPVTTRYDEIRFNHSIPSSLDPISPRHSGVPSLIPPYLDNIRQPESTFHQTVRQGSHQRYIDAVQGYQPSLDVNRMPQQNRYPYFEPRVQQYEYRHI